MLNRSIKPENRNPEAKTVFLIGYLLLGIPTYYLLHVIYYLFFSYYSYWLYLMLFLLIISILVTALLIPGKVFCGL